MKTIKLYKNTVTILFDKERHRFFHPDGKSIKGVTSYTGVLDKPALIPWATKMMGLYLYQNWDIGKVKTDADKKGGGGCAGNIVDAEPQLVCPVEYAASHEQEHPSPYQPQACLSVFRHDCKAVIMTPLAIHCILRLNLCQARMFKGQGP